MKTDETVRELCELIRTPRLDFFRTYDELADRILAAHEREMAAKDAEIARMHDCCDALEDEMDVKDKEISRLKAALKPVMECALENKMCRAVSVKSDDDEMDARLKVSVWIDMSNAVSAVREAQRVMREFTNGESHN